MKRELDVSRDPTLVAADAVMEARGATKPRRWYVGMSAAGHCSRKNFYSYRGVASEPFNAQTLRNFSSGNRAEPVVIDRLRAVAGLDIIDRDQGTGKQIEVSDFDGHFLGHLDFECIGLLQAPKTFHVGEVKECGEKKLREFRRIKERVGEKNTLQQWNESYWAQHQLYMHYRRRKRGWLVVASAGVRDWDACRTEYDADAAARYIERARRIIYEPQHIPDRISEDPSYFVCKWCEFHSVCHGPLAGQATVTRNCRTCAFGRPHNVGAWHCQKHNQVLDEPQQRVGCSDQRYLPSLVRGSVSAVGDDYIEYEMPSGKWTDHGAEE